MNLPDLDILTAEELAEFKKDVKAITNDPQASIDITYHHTGTVTTNDFTGNEGETGDSEDTIKALQVEIAEEELQKLRTKKVKEALLIAAEDLTKDPTIHDWITTGGITKYVKAFHKPPPGAFWKVYLGDEGNG